MNRFSSGDVLCIHDGDLLRVKGTTSWIRVYTGSLAVVLCRSEKERRVFFDDYVNVIVEGQLMELLIGAYVDNVADVLVKAPHVRGQPR